ncbi:hypothetical protein E3N88_01106 [Mikania micrantha]|uniref:Protein kinase domain-containing protein n=1 Tax=Mikania micrantha TaxID=192012 RepID=A0A5N6Q2T0_9ASTR|nr:hypothetical protein E3N88_01106 [Mikania micrantha]
MRRLITGLCPEISDRELSEESSSSNLFLFQITMEITTMKLIKHPNVVRLYEVMGSKTKIYMVFEFVTGGDLFDKIVELGRMRENEARKYFQQLINAVDCCHSRGVYHRDLKPENLLLDASGNLKVSDFAMSALSRQVRDDGLLNTTCGSPNYVAPEVLKNRGYDGAAADLWSCGVILYALLAGFLPFDDSNLVNLYKKIMTADFTCPSWFSFSAMKLINRILDPNPMTRITISELKHNEWFSKDFKQNELMEIEETGSDDLEATFQKLELAVMVVVVLLFSVAGCDGLWWWYNGPDHVVVLWYSVRPRDELAKEKLGSVDWPVGGVADAVVRFPYHSTKKKEEHLASMNAFELITMSKGLNLCSFFDMEQGYRFEDILSATANFSDENLIAEGAFGKVYKGQLLQSGNSMNVAIRRFDCKYGKGDELQMEISMLKSLKHKNIVSIFKRFDENNEKIIIYEQSFHGTLYQHLSDPTLTWTQRLQICLGVAHALDYIHYDVIHCDISSSKIFLDKDWEPKIYGFELSTTYPQSLRHRLLFSRYFDTSNMTPKYDVYSFGVLLFEVLCGRKPMITNEGVQEEVDQIIDPKLRKQMDSQSLALFTNIANNCLNQYLVQRPTMDQIVKELEDVLELQLKHANLEHSIAADAGTPSNSVKMEFLKISLSEIRLATNDFDESYSIGCGGYGVVYKAILDVLDIQSFSSMEGKHKDELPKISKTVAIKRIFNRADEQGKQGFLTEIELLTSCKHPNIVSLLGFSKEAREMILVYEYAFKGSLSDYLGSSDPEIIQEDDDRILTLNRGPNQASFDTFSKIAYQCLAETQAKRPTMEVVVTELQKAFNLQGDSMVISRFLLSDIVLATKNFAKINCIGLDMNGEVYKAELEHFGNNGLLETKGKNNGEPSNKHISVAIKRITSRIEVHMKVYEDPEYEKRGKFRINDRGLAPIARRCINDGTLESLMDPKLKEENDEDIFTSNGGPNQDSLNTFLKIASKCLEKAVEHPTMETIIKELEIALHFHAELPKDYKDIIKMSKTPEIYSTAKRKDLYNTLSKGILIQEGKVWFSLGSNGERNEMVSASQFSYGNHQKHIWRSVQESRFDKIAEMSDISHLNIHIKIRTRSLSPGVNYGVHLVFKFCGARKSVAKRMYVNLTYKMGNETFHAYFATWREDEWMTIELYRFLNHKELDTVELDFLLESFSRFYCGKRSIYVEGVELRAVEKHEENDDVIEVQQVNMDPMQQMPTVDAPFDICSVFTRTLLKLFSWRNNEKQNYMLSANEAFCDSLNAGRFTFKPSTKSRFQKVIELLSTHVFLIKCKIKSQLLLQNTEYVCYLVFKLSEKCCGLHCPVIVRDLRKHKNQQTEVVYFRSPSLWNIDDVNRIPQEREDGWMEVCVWKFRSNYDQLQNNCISMNLKFVSYEGTMSGLIVSGLEFRPM